MFERTILARLEEWKRSSDRKPLILRGARQVGKTTAVELFARDYDQFISLNLEKPAESALFSRDLAAKEVFQAILLQKNLPRHPGRVLLFLDEIQNTPAAIRMLRYFHEDLPDLDVIAAGSLIEIALSQKQIGMPVGRVQHFFMYPLTFAEFLDAIGEHEALQAFKGIPVSEAVIPGLFGLFHKFALTGGMPEIVARFALDRDVVSLQPLYQALITSFLDDIPRYARNETMRRILRHCFEAAPVESGQRIKFAGFGKSNYRSREVGEAMRTLEQAMLVHLLYPTTSTEIPLVPDYKKAPRLQFLDVGLVNHAAGLQGHYFEHSDLHSFYRGKIAEMIVAQEIIAAGTTSPRKPGFWVREKRQAPAEVDFVIQHGKYAVPVEVKAGATGSLRSLHQFINRCPHRYAVRMHGGPLAVHRLATHEGKDFILLDLPYFLAGRLSEYIAWAIERSG